MIITKMLRKKHLLSIASALLIGASFSTSSVLAKESGNQNNNQFKEGQELAFTRKKGNCLACHMIKGGNSPGNIAPPLIVMKARYPDKKKLRDQIWDASQRNPETSMPLFGRYEVLTEDEIDKLTDFIYSL